jgi:hypothetical protein
VYKAIVILVLSATLPLWSNARGFEKRRGSGSLTLSAHMYYFSSSPRPRPRHYSPPLARHYRVSPELRCHYGQEATAPAVASFFPSQPSTPTTAATMAMLTGEPLWHPRLDLARMPPKPLRPLTTQAAIPTYLPPPCPFHSKAAGDGDEGALLHISFVQAAREAL